MIPRELTLSDIVSNSLQIIKEILQTSKTIKCKVFDQESYEAWNGGGGGAKILWQREGHEFLFFNFSKYSLLKMYIFDSVNISFDQKFINIYL